MLKNSSKIFLGLLPFLDIMFEYFYQARVYLTLDSILGQYTKFSKEILDNHSRSHIKTAVLHTLEHNTIHLAIICVCIALISITVNAKARTRFLNAVSSCFYLFPQFLGVSSFEILLLEIQCSFIRIFESKWIWNLFVPKNNVIDFLWPLFVILIWVPLEIRFKIFLESKLHYRAPVFIGVLHAASTVLFPFVHHRALRLFFDCSLGALLPLPDVKDPVQIYLIQSAQSSLEIYPVSYPGYSCVLLKGDVTHHPEHVNASLMFEAFRFGVVSKFYSLIAPFIKNLIFAMVVIYSDKRYLKMFCSSDIHHICAHLIFEELLNVGVSRYILSPFTVFENYLISSCDSRIGEYTDINKAAHSYFDLQLHSHKNLHPSPFYSLFNNEINVIERIEKVLKL